MEVVTELSTNPLALYIPVAIALLGLILVYIFGFKSADQPPFDKLTTDDRKPAGKKRKIKEKKTTANGHVSTGESKHEKSPSKETKRSPAKDVTETKQKDKNLENNKQSEKNKKNEAIKNNKQNVEEVKNKKNLKKVAEKPVDFDDGNWETVPSKSDKKKKPDQSPAKKDIKKSKKIIEKVDKVEIEKLAKEVVNKELREKEKEAKVEPVHVTITEQVIDEPVVVVEEKKEKKKEKKVKKEVKTIEKIVESKEPAKEVPKVKTEKVAKTEKVPQSEAKSAAPKDSSGAVAFDELGDVWTEAKAAKKSKKKARRDN